MKATNGIEVVLNKKWRLI